MPVYELARNDILFSLHDIAPGGYPICFEKIPLFLRIFTEMLLEFLGRSAKIKGAIF
jgi:hypothetical protein